MMGLLGKPTNIEDVDEQSVFSASGRELFLAIQMKEAERGN